MMTIEEIQVRKECQTFDCKSIQIDPKSLAVPIVAMANANDGVIMKAEKLHLLEMQTVIKQAICVSVLQMCCKYGNKQR